MKVAVAAALLVLLLKLGRLDFSVLQRLRPDFSTVALFIAGIIAVAVGNGFAALRLWTLLLHSGLIISFQRVLAITFIGSFVGYVLPGLVLGDAFKTVYLCREVSDRKTSAVAIVIIDRLVGLFSFLLLSSLALLLGLAAHYVAGELLFLLIVPAIVAAVVIAAYLFNRYGLRLFQLQRWSRHGLLKYIQESIVVLRSYIKSIRIILLTILYSFIDHLLIVVSFIIAARIIGDRSPLYAHFILDPLAMVTNAIPITPGGLGIAESAFSFLYEVIGSNNGGMLGLVGRFFQYTAFIFGGITAFILLDTRVSVLSNNRN